MKRMDPDIKVLKACVRALDRSSSARMLKANVEYLYDRYVLHPRKDQCFPECPDFAKSVTR